MVVSALLLPAVMQARAKDWADENVGFCIRRSWTPLSKLVFFSLHLSLSLGRQSLVYITLNPQFVCISFAVQRQ